MTQEDKKLLIKELFGRLPYGVKVNISASNRYDNFVKSINDATINYIDLNIEKCRFKEFWWDTYIVNVRPYLRPMSSMTEEEKKELKEISENYLDEWQNTETSIERWKLDAKVSYKRAVFYNSHHIDWNDLISKGLALEAPEGMYQ